MEPGLQPSYMNHRSRRIHRAFAFLLAAFVAAGGRVENWRGGPSGRWLGCIRGFSLRARLALSVAPFPVPATSHAACGFPALRAPAHFVSKLMGPIHMARLPRTTVGKPPGTHQRAPVSGTARPGSIASTRIPGADGLCPDGAGSSSLPSFGCTRNSGSNGQSQSTSPKASEYLLELAQQGRPFLAFRHIQRHPSSPP